MQVNYDKVNIFSVSTGVGGLIYYVSRIKQLRKP